MEVCRNIARPPAFICHHRVTKRECMKDGKYSIELLREGEGHDIEIVLTR
jgi:hypothetical protein